MRIQNVDLGMLTQCFGAWCRKISVLRLLSSSCRTSLNWPQGSSAMSYFYNPGRVWRCYCHLGFSLMRYFIFLKKRISTIQSSLTIGQFPCTWRFLKYKSRKQSMLEAITIKTTMIFQTQGCSHVSSLSSLAQHHLPKQKGEINSLEIWSWSLSTSPPPQFCNSIQHFLTLVVRNELLFWFKLCVVSPSPPNFFAVDFSLLQKCVHCRTFR